MAGDAKAPSRDGAIAVYKLFLKAWEPKTGTELKTSLDALIKAITPYIRGRDGSDSEWKLARLEQGLEAVVHEIDTLRGGIKEVPKDYMILIRRADLDSLQVAIDSMVGDAGGP